MEQQLLKQVLREYDEKRNKAIFEANMRKNELLKSNSKLAEIESKLSSISIQSAKEILKADNKNSTAILNNLKKQTSALLKEKNTILKELSSEKDLLNPQFECSLCKDSGYINSSMCNCLKQKIFDIAYNKSNIGNLSKENFSNFNMKLFSDKPDRSKFNSDISPRANMQILKERAEYFVNNFDNPEEKNLIFTGDTGIGKTFLTNCIANEILKQGKVVLYQTAPVMFDYLIDEKFGKSTSNLFQNVLEADLLIIDDLGTEKITNQINDLKFEELFTIINTRLLNQNHKVTKTIISTNLNVKELFEIYTDRIGSRLAGHYDFLRFFGDDIRFKKTKKEM